MLCYILLMMLFNVIFSLSNSRLITFEIEENVPIGTKIVDLRTMIFPQPPKNVRMSLTSNPYFHIQEESIVYIKGIIDRDLDRNLCKNPEFPMICLWSSFILLDSGKHFDLKITILDQNDNVPKWEMKFIHLRIPENTPIGYQLEFPLATDFDSGLFGIQRYGIIPVSSIFHVSEVIVGGSSPKLILSKYAKLDRELKAWHNLTLYAYDGGTNALSGSVSILIEILDENDNDPLFGSSHYQCNVDEDIQPGSILPLNIKAFDADSENYGKLSFKFVLSTPQYITDYFKISSTTGQVSTKKSLNYKNRRLFYEFTIIAEDGGIPHRTAETNVKIQINDKNTHAPKISINAMPDPTSKFISVKENSKPNVIIASFTIEDKDKGLNSKFNCSLRGSDSDDFILKYSKRLGRLEIYFLYTLKSFDREKQSSCAISIICEDFGTPQLTSIKDVMIEIIDVNDNSPQFDKSEYHIRTTEGNEPNSLVYQVSATDLDKGENSKLRYEIEDFKEQYKKIPFIIDSGGKIISKNVLDREKNPNGYDLIIRAFDHGIPPRSATTHLRIELEDVNDCSPEFSKNRYDLQIEEDSGDIFRRRYVGQVSAEDKDLRENAIVFYRLSQESNVPFEIDSKAGSIFTSRLLDRETSSSQISFLCIAVDNPNNLLFRKTSTVEVVIEIIDVNDNKPEFVFPNDTHQVVNLSYYARRGFVVTTIVAKDNDIGINAEIRYVITKGNSQRLFELNESTGMLQLSRDLKPSNKGYEVLTIKAIDSGKSQVHMIASQLRIIIDNFNFLVPSGSQEANQRTENERGILYFEWWEPNKLIIICILLATALISCILIGAICVMAKRRNANVDKDDIKMVNIHESDLCKQRMSQSSIFEDNFYPNKTDLELTTKKLLCYDPASNNVYFDGHNCLHTTSPNYILT